MIIRAEASQVLTRLRLSSTTLRGERIKQIRRKTQRRREQCRTNQARYRMKQMKHAVILEETVQSLRVEIPALDMQRNRLLYGSKQSIWSVVVEYAHIFRFGVPVASKPLPTYPSMKSFQDTDTKRQLAFLRSTMSDDLILCELRGVNALMDQWRRYASSFQDLYFQLECIQGLSEKFVTGLASLSVTITETTLATVFPHLFGSGRIQEDLGYDAKLEPWRAEILASKLLGQRLRLPCSLCFEWDVESSRVMRLEMTVGFLTPLLQVLGRLEDAAAVMEHALITPCGAIDINGESNSWGHIE
ncbi:hypothetical protein BBO99_00000406 [Phytophthora kernoviae]|uniref:BZIP domain-containing protein n=1 Tax=Phytophthora kernoviae TaxID=325452 RepID=A0A3R7H3E4_9STRA|nr:hypothetical protein BBI17_000411 [Phytophthora kernoviae]RLN85632.1 hypothetical protein BBO99_00000406 [Phytophthora kernoviae]